MFFWRGTFFAMIEAVLFVLFVTIRRIRGNHYGINRKSH